MGNTKSNNIRQNSETTYSKVSDHLSDLANELIKLDNQNEAKKFNETINNLILILYNILTKETSFNGKTIALDKDPKYIINLNIVKNWYNHKLLLKSCCIKMSEYGTFAQTDEYGYYLRSLLAILKYCTYQNKQTITPDTSTLDPDSIFKNQVEDFFKAYKDNINFPNNSQTQNNTPISSNKPHTEPNYHFSRNTQPVNNNMHTPNKSTTTETPSKIPTFNPINITVPKSRTGKRTIGLRRLESERKVLLSNQNEGIRLVQELGNIWIVEIDGAVNTLYENETYTLRFKFEDNYPIESPEVVFVNTPPIHPHIYSDGSICLSILYDAWSPALGVVSICLSLISMLSSCKKKKKPDDDLAHSFKGPSNPKQTLWHFHDEKV